MIRVSRVNPFQNVLQNEKMFEAATSKFHKDWRESDIRWDDVKEMINSKIIKQPFVGEVRTLENAILPKGYEEDKEGTIGAIFTDHEVNVEVSGLPFYEDSSWNPIFGFVIDTISVDQPKRRADGTFCKKNARTGSQRREIKTYYLIYRMSSKFWGTDWGEVMCVESEEMEGCVFGAKITPSEWFKEREIIAEAKEEERRLKEVTVTLGEWEDMKNEIKELRKGLDKALEEIHFINNRFR